VTTLANILLFQAGWLACVLGAASGMPWLSGPAVAAILAWHLSRARKPWLELGLAGLCALTGIAFESVLAQTGWVSYDTGQVFPGTAPYWMVALWVMFATTLNVSLRPLRTKLRLAAVLGAIGSPMAYFGGARLDALEITAHGPALLAIAIGWALLTPLLMRTARVLDGYASA